jgi:DNA-binding protein YbaB
MKLYNQVKILSRSKALLEKDNKRMQSEMEKMRHELAKLQVTWFLCPS